MSGDVLKSSHVRVNALPLVIATPQFSPARPAEPVGVMADAMQSEIQLAQMEVEAAHHEAERVLQTAEQQAVEILRSAQQKGFDAGFAAGRTAGESEARAMLLMSGHIFEQSRLWQREMVAQSEITVRSLLNEIAGKLFGKGFEVPPERLQGVVSRALDKARDLGKTRVRMNPQDIEIVRSLTPAGLNFAPDDSIVRGGCVVEAEFGTVDSRVETQLAEVTRAMTGDS
jgi:flagellar assembly protein FliH